MTKTAIVSNSNGYPEKPKKTITKQKIESSPSFPKDEILVEEDHTKHIDEETHSYFSSIIDRIQKGFESIEDKVAVANDVLEQTREKEILLASNRMVSRVIEDLIAFANPEHFERFLTSLSVKFRFLCSHSFASHVVEKIINVCFLRAVYYKKRPEKRNSKPANKKMRVDLLSEETYNITQEFTNAHRQVCSEFIRKIGNFLLNNLADFLCDPYGNHVIRTSIFSLVGIHKTKVEFGRNEEVLSHEEVVEVPRPWIEIVKKCVKRLQSWRQFPEFPYYTLCSLTLSYLIIALRTCDEAALDRLGSKILIEAFLKADHGKDKSIAMIENENEEQKNQTEESETGGDVTVLPKVFRNTSSVRLLETMLSAAGDNLFSQLYAMLFMGRVRTLALNRLTNFAVQRMIKHIHNPADFESVFEELHASMESIINVGHTGVIESLAKTCLDFRTKQEEFISALLNALHISGSEEKFDSLIICILKLKLHEVAIEDKSQFIHLHGALILQHMLQFEKPIKLVQGILEVPAHDLAVIFSSAHGSFVADAFIKSKSIEEKSREKLLKHLKGEYLSMATSQYGSRVVENLFRIANMKQKTKIAKELSESCEPLKESAYGKFVYKSLDIDLYRSTPTQWMTTEKEDADKTDDAKTDIEKEI